METRRVRRIKRARIRRTAGAVVIGALSAAGLSIGLAAPAGASADVCVSTHGTTRVDKGSSRCFSDSSSTAVAVNDSNAVASFGSRAVAANGSQAQAIFGGHAEATKGCFASAFADNEHCHG
jgi:hypothetical protein